MHFDVNLPPSLMFPTKWKELDASWVIICKSQLSLKKCSIKEEEEEEKEEEEEEEKEDNDNDDDDDDDDDDEGEDDDDDAWCNG